MNEKSFGTTLRALRENSKKSVKEVIEELKEYNIFITDKTLYSYENNKRTANVDMFLALCKIYKCNNVMEVFSDTVDDVLFTNEEWNIIEKYRTLDEHGKEMVDFTLTKEWERSLSIQKTENIINISNRTELAAAHARTDITPTLEGQAHDNAIMDDDSEWE